MLYLWDGDKLELHYTVRCVCCRGIRDRKKELPAALWLPLISVIGGFLFSILWEAQCRYVFPYYMFLILYAPMGLYAVGRMIGGLWNLHKGNRIRNQADTDEELREIA